jgi:hypothetical protein
VKKQLAGVSIRIAARDIAKLVADDLLKPSTAALGSIDVAADGRQRLKFRLGRGILSSSET